MGGAFERLFCPEGREFGLGLMWILDPWENGPNKMAVARNTDRRAGSFCEYRGTNDVKQKKQKTENNSTPK